MKPACLQLSALLCLTAAQPGGAQSLAEQVISARPSPVPLLQAPVSATVLGIGDLDRFGINTTQEIALRSPALTAYSHEGPLQLRGLGAVIDRPGVAPAIAVFSDGVYLGDSAGIDSASFFDLERVEIIRGPGGVRSGYNALGGAINLYSAQPTATWQSKVLAELGSDDYRALQGLIRGPITDQFSMSVAGSAGQQPHREGHRYTPGDDGSRDTQYLRGAFTYHWTNLWYSTLQLVHSDSDDNELDSASLVNEIALGGQRLKHTASWYQRESTDRSEADAQTLTWYSDFAGRFNFDNGLSWYQSDEQSAEIPDPRITASSAWGSATWSLTDRIGISAGLRYTTEEKESEHDREDDYLDWHLGLDYSWRGQLFYAAANTGHGDPGARVAAHSPIEPDSLTALELGHKGQYLNGRLHTATAVYYYDLEDLDDLRAGSGHAVGVEAQWHWIWNQHLNIGGSWGHSNGALPAPRNQLALSASGQWRWGWVSMEAVLEYLYREAYCARQDLCAGSLTQWDGSLTASYGLWRMTAYAENISDADSGRDVWLAAPHTMAGAVSVNAPRSLGIRVTYQLW